MIGITFAMPISFAQNQSDMDALFNRLTTKLNISDEQARKGTGLFFRVARDRLDDVDFKSVAEQIGGGRVVCGLSGGVASSVAAALVHRAIGEQLTGIFVDNGLLRLGEREEVKRIFGESLGVPLVTVDAAERFVNALAGVDDPERCEESLLEIIPRDRRKVYAMRALVSDVVDRDSFFENF